MSVPESTAETLHIAAQAADDKGGEDLVALDVSGPLPLVDVFLLASGRSERNVDAIAGEIEDRVNEAGVKTLRREGRGEGRWVLLDFGGSKGQMPTGALLLGPNGALYGTASQLAYELRPPSSGSGAWTEHQLYSFTGATGDAYSPQSGFVAGPGPVLYGQSVGGGASNLGTVYQLTPPAVQGGAWTENVLYSFQGGTDGSVPVGPLVRPHPRSQGRRPHPPRPTPRPQPHPPAHQETPASPTPA